MKTANVTIEGIRPHSPSRFYDPQREGKETADELEKRTWRQRIHVNAAGAPFIPPMMLKKCLESASSYLGKIPGERNATYTKRFKSGILITDELLLFKSNDKNGWRPATLDDFEGEWLFLDANGKPGGTRVKRCMPRILNPWRATSTIYVLDEVINRDVLAKAFEDAGTFVGLGRFRPANGGFYGRFKLVDIQMS